jgi:hypothetical protein
MRLLLESEAAWTRLQALVATYSCLGKQIHDANVVATALVNGVTRLITANVEDFSRFVAEIEVTDLAALAG